MKKRAYVLWLGVWLLSLLAVPATGATPIVMWFSSQPVPVTEWAETFQDTFNERNPDIRLSVEMHPRVSALREKLIVAVAGGVAPDIFYESSNVMSQWILSELALPIDRYLNAMPDRSDLIPDAVRALRYGGKTWALPFSVWPIGDLYNIDMFEGSGLARPASWKELEMSARRLLQVGEGGQITLFGYRKPHNELANFLDLQLAMEQLGSTAIATEGTKSNLRTDVARQALTYMRDIVQAGMPNSAGGSDLASILGGKVAVQHMYPGYELIDLADQISAAGLNLEFHRYVGPETKKDLVHHNAGTFFIVSSTRNPDEAWRVLQAFLERRTLKGYLMAHGSCLSVRLSQRTDPDLLARPYCSSLIAALVSPITTYGPNNPYYPHFRQPAGAFLRQAVNGELAIETALEQAADVMDVIVADKIGSAGK
ncbi:MAG: ABC transporter substrate-binding protein [Limnochordia bacterium]